jgi:flavin reductase (DIM6/NTAB) family NADH-FMN oxidoreductase RutF
MDIPLEDFYKLVAPRPIALIVTVDKEGKINAAPMSFIMPIEMDPPIIAFSTGYDGDTYKNISETGEFVIGMVGEKIKKEMYVCGGSFPHGVNELEKAGLRWGPSEKVKPPHVVECFANFECKLDWMQRGPEYVVIAGRVVAAGLQKNAIRAGKLNVEQVKPLLHLSGKTFVVGDRTVGL